VKNRRTQEAASMHNHKSLNLSIKGEGEPLMKPTHLIKESKVPSHCVFCDSKLVSTSGLQKQQKEQ